MIPSYTLAIVRACLHGCALAMLVALLTLFARRLGPTVRCWLWWLVLAQFALGWLWLAPIAISAPEKLDVVGWAQTDVARVSVPDRLETGEDGESFDWRWLLAAGWLAGAAGVATAKAAGTRRMAAIRRKAIPAGHEVQTALRRLGAEMGLPAAPKALQSDAIDSPAVFGLWRPVVLLPESCAKLPDVEIEMALTHELAHIARRDTILALVPELAVTLFWFLPIAHWARREWIIERELACDQAVFRRMRSPAKEYRRLLLRMIERDARPVPAPALGATADYRCLKRRLAASPEAKSPRAPQVLCLLAVGALSIPVTLQPRVRSGGLLANPGFEAGSSRPNEWSTGERLDGVRYIWDPSVTHTGRRSLSIRKRVDRYFPIAQWSQRVRYDGRSKAIEFTAWARARNAYKSVLDVQFATDDGIATHAWVAYVGAKYYGDAPESFDWKLVGGRVAIPKGTKEIVLALQDYGPGQIWFDDVSARFVDDAPKHQGSQP